MWPLTAEIDKATVAWQQVWMGDEKRPWQNGCYIPTNVIRLLPLRDTMCGIRVTRHLLEFRTSKCCTQLRCKLSERAVHAVLETDLQTHEAKQGAQGVACRRAGVHDSVEKVVARKCGSEVVEGRRGMTTDLFVRRWRAPWLMGITLCAYSEYEETATCG